jgi:hypothetical protein
MAEVPQDTEAINPCSSCSFNNSCKNERLACRNFRFYGTRGDSPNKHWYLELHGINVDGINRTLLRMVSAGCGLYEIVEWINVNVDPSVLHKISIPASIRPQIFMKMWRHMPIEKIELEDFLCTLLE